MARPCIQSHYFSSFCLVLYLGNGGTVAQAQTVLQGLTFKEALATCHQAVSSGDLASAADLFHNLEATFGAEEEFQKEEIQRQILPLKGLSELGAGRNKEAAETLMRLQETFPQLLNRNASLLYGLAQAHRGTGNLNEARTTLEIYAAQFPGTVEAGIANLERLDLFFQEKLSEEGLEAVDQFLASNAADSLKMQAQLKAVQACLDDRRMTEAAERMLGMPWSIATMPELAQLAFLALQCGEHALAEGNHQQALRLFHLVPPKPQLIRLQNDKLKALSMKLIPGRSRALFSTTRHQQSYLSGLEQQMSQQLEALERAEDYTPVFYLHYGQCLLLDNQFYKAWLVFEYLALRDQYPQAVREEAHYRWVICAHQLAEWEEALTLARNFVDRYPQSALAPQALYLIAKAHLEQRRFPESVEILTDLIDRFPKHPLLGRWLFTRGFNQVVLEAYDKARSDFASFETHFPQEPLVVNAKLWSALTHYFEKEYPICIEQLEALLELDNRHPLYPEILYRLASAYYSAREYEEALNRIEIYLGNFTRHQRVDEARILKGDIAMGLGKLEAATQSFKEVSIESPDLYLYSLFQMGKIFRAQEDHLRMAEHFRSFLENPESPKIRISEALYWLGWAYQQQDRLDLAFPVFVEALNTYGNDPQAAETQSILQALQKLKRRQSPGTTSFESRLMEATDFETWLMDEIEKAREAKRFTYYSRLILFYHNRFPRLAATRFPLEELAEAIPMKDLDPDALGKVGLILLEGADSRAKDYFTYLLEAHSRSNARAMGYLGLARIAVQHEDFGKAETWLRKSMEQIPVHALMNETHLLLGKVLSQLRQYEASIKTYEQLLRLKSARGRPQATALQGIATAYEDQGDPVQAIAYYQRIYNMYRAYPDLVALAYWKSARLFEILDKIPEAVNTLQEMLKQGNLSKYPEWIEAKSRLPTLLSLMPNEDEIEQPQSLNRIHE